MNNNPQGEVKMYQEIPANKLKKWFQEHNINAKEIAQQLGLSSAQSVYIIFKNWRITYRNKSKLIRLGVPEDLLPPLSLSNLAQNNKKPQWPNLINKEENND